MVRVNIKSSLIAVVIFLSSYLLPVLKREKGGKGKAEPLKPIFY